MPDPTQWTSDDADDINDIESKADQILAKLTNDPPLVSDAIALATALKNKASAMKLRHQS